MTRFSGHTDVNSVISSSGFTAGPLHEEVDVAIGDLAVRSVQTDIERREHNTVLYLDGANPNRGEQMWQCHVGFKLLRALENHVRYRRRHRSRQRR